MSISCLKTAALAAAICLPALAAAAEDAVPASVSSCVSCHSADGNPLVAGVPILAGQREEYLVNALKAYRAGRRSGGGADVMQRYAKTLNDTDIQEIARWFAQN